MYEVCHNVKGEAMPELPEEHAVTIEALMDEQRKFTPSEEFKSQANINSQSIYAEGDDYVSFWDGQAANISWRTPWTQTLDWSNAPFAKWFVDD
ncbi:acetyl-coenzyme A synthetase [mine drainage metagenome]|uniref:Acetyl-coenzyme A synthetase n=1 Tax=mine drainage metagenome TaxID=410659 RepID=T0Y308_9ZZZZ